MVLVEQSVENSSSPQAANWIKAEARRADNGLLFAKVV
jgi:hypothetical protein